MKKKIIAITAALVLAIGIYLMGNTPGNNACDVLNPVGTTDISLIVYRSYDYTQSLYNTSVAAINLTVSRINSTGTSTPVWSTKINSQSLKQYPDLADAIRKNVTLPASLSKDGTLLLQYDVIYDSNGHQLEIPKTVLLDKKSGNTVSIRI